MKRRHRISNSRKLVLGLGVSIVALSASLPVAMAQEAQGLPKQPNLKVLVYNIWNKGAGSGFWRAPSDADYRFTAQMSNFLTAVNPDVIVYPELGNNFFSAALAGQTFETRFVNNTINLLNEHRGTPGAYVKNDSEGAAIFWDIGDVLTYYPLTNLPGNRISISPTNGFPNAIINGIHLDYNDDPTGGRIPQAKAINQFVRDALEPVISAGDFNAADVSERGLLSADQQLKSFARDLSSTSDFSRKALDNYARNPEHRALLSAEISYWTEAVTLNGSSRPRYQSVVPNWSSSSWDARLKHLTAAILQRNPSIAFSDETYPVKFNAPVTMNILKQGNQILQLAKNTEIFANSNRFDGRSTWTSDGREEENVWQWWDRSVIDHIIASRPYAKWMVADESDPNAGILNGRTTAQSGVDPSDHEPVAQNILWYGPKLTIKPETKNVDLSFSAQDRNFNEAGEFHLSRNNHRTDIRFDNIADADGRPFYRDDSDASGRIGRKPLTDAVNSLIAKGQLKPQDGLDYANDPNAALKMRIPCDNRNVLETIAGAAELCVDSHAKFDALAIRDGVVAFDEVAALGNDTGAITLNNAGLRSAEPNDAWARWTASPSGTINKPISIAEGIGSFEVSDRESDIVVNGVISGEGSFEKRGEGSLVLAGENTYAGATVLRAGQLVAGSASAFGASGIVDISGGRLDLGGNDLLINELKSTAGAIDVGTGNLALNFSEDTQVASSFEGEGLILKTGNSNLNLTGNSAHEGLLAVSEGSLTVGDAAHSNASIASDTVLLENTSVSGTGKIGSLTATSGSIIRPGNSIGTLRIERDLNVDAGSRFEVEIAGDGRSDQLVVGGAAVLNGGLVEVTTVDPQQSYRSRQLYRILNAEGGVEGRFEQVSSQSAFLGLGLVYSANSVDLDIIVKADFTEAALTASERKTAEALSSLEQTGPSLELYNSLLPLSSEQSREAYNALSGEIHASLKGALLDDSRFARQAANKRLLGSDKGDGLTFWSDAYGAWGRTKGDGNAAKIDRDTGGLFFGGDAAVADTWQLGIFGGYGASTYEAKARGSKADVDSYTLGAYAGTWFDPVGLRVGLANSWHSLDVARTVTFGDFDEALSSSYDARTLQVFGEVSSKVDLGVTVIEPFAGLAYVKLDAENYAEQGLAGLSGTGRDEDQTYSTFGFRFEDDLAIAGTNGKLKGSFAWQHAFGSDVPSAEQQFATGSSFRVAGAPIAKDTALIEFGYDLSLSENTSLGLAYQGQLGSGTQSHGVNAKFQLRF